MATEIDKGTETQHHNDELIEPAVGAKRRTWVRKVVWIAVIGAGLGVAGMATCTLADCCWVFCCGMLICVPC